MNGLSRPPERQTAAELRRQLALVEACEPIEDACAEAKRTYREALVTGDADVISAAKAAKAEAARRLNDTRRWLRGEARVGVLKTRLAGSRGAADREKDERELASLDQILAPYRAVLGTPLTTRTPAPAGITEAVAPAVTVRSTGGAS